MLPMSGEKSAQETFEIATVPYRKTPSEAGYENGCSEWALRAIVLIASCPGYHLALYINCIAINPPRSHLYTFSPSTLRLKSSLQSF